MQKHLQKWEAFTGTLSGISILVQLIGQTLISLVYQRCSQEFVLPRQYIDMMLEGVSTLTEVARNPCKGWKILFAIIFRCQEGLLG